MLIQISSTFIVSSTQISMEREQYLLLWKKLKELGEDLASLFAKFSESIPESEQDNLTKNNVMALPILSMIQKDTVSLNGSSTDSEIIRKVRTYKWPQTFLKQN